MKNLIMMSVWWTSIIIVSIVLPHYSGAFIAGSIFTTIWWITYSYWSEK